MYITATHTGFATETATWPSHTAHNCVSLTVALTLKGSPECYALLCSLYRWPSLHHKFLQIAFDDAYNAYQRGDYLTAAKTFRKLAEQGDADATIQSWLMYDNGQGVLQDYAEAVKWYRLAADQGMLRHNPILGHVREGQGVPQDYAEAVKWYRLAADQGDAERNTILVSCTIRAKAFLKTTQKL